MNSDELQLIATQAKITLSGKDGFIDCRIESNSPPILAFEFDSPATAAQFQLMKAASKSTFKYSIQQGYLHIVLEYR